LEKQNVQVLLGLNISAIALSSENTDTENFWVSINNKDVR
jgi:hypothetical protein